MPKVTAIVLVGGRGSRLQEITETTAKPAVSFGGKYRLIDFVLSNLSNSGITSVGLITQYEPHDLMNYIGNASTWDLDVNNGGVSFLTPYTTKDGQKWQQGTAHAIMQHFKYIENQKSDLVLVLSGDQVYKMDYNDLISSHIKRNAEITVSAQNIKKNPERYGIIEVDKSCLITNFEEKPSKPKTNYASMGIYVFNKDVLYNLLSNNPNLYDFGSDIIPHAIAQNYKIYARGFKGYFKDVGTIEGLYEANMDLIDNPGFLKLHEFKSMPIYTKSSNNPPHHIPSESILSNSYICDACLIYGDIIHSIISTGVFVKRGSKVIDSIIHEHVEIGENCIIQNAIVTKNTIIPNNTRLEFDNITVVDQRFLEAGDYHE